MTEMLSPEVLTAFFQVVIIDLVLAGDNAVVIGLAAAGLHESQRNKAILVGIFAATILRIGFASITVQLLEMIGLLLAGGILLLWVCWKMWRELRTSPAHDQNAKAALNDQDINADGMIPGRLARRSARPYGRSRSPMCRCRSIMCWRSPVPPASTRLF